MDYGIKAARPRRGLSGSTLKLFAIVSMLVDHVGAVILGRMLLTQTYLQTRANTVWVEDYGRLYDTYQVMRGIGRLAFPIFCFLLVEGFTRTSDVKKYAVRLGIFSLLSEIPFDLAFKARFLEFSYQNVFFTLLLGLLAMMAVDWVLYHVWSENPRLQSFLSFVLAAAVTVCACAAAELLRADYGAKGVFCIVILYLTRRRKSVQMLAGALSFLWEVPAPAAFVPLCFYNGKRGFRLKYVFYIFYPAHLLLLYLVSFLLGFAETSVF